MTCPYIAVLGGLNMDLVLQVERAPIAGETVSSDYFRFYPGGKGANQAIACARLGAEVKMIGRLGGDAFASELRSHLAQANVDQRYVSTDLHKQSGMAMIVVEGTGQNRIVFAPGANHSLLPENVSAAAHCITAAALLICQLEVPYACVLESFRLARLAGVPILFNPAPAQMLSAESLTVDYLVLNETEAALLTKSPVNEISQAMQATTLLQRLGARTVLLTLGAEGVVLGDSRSVRHYPALAVQAIDTTAAGDTFIGGLAAHLIAQHSLDEAVRFGIAAAALCVSRHGAQPSIPFKHEVTIGHLEKPQFLSETRRE